MSCSLSVLGALPECLRGSLVTFLLSVACARRGSSVLEEVSLILMSGALTNWVAETELVEDLGVEVACEVYCLRGVLLVKVGS